MYSTDEVFYFREPIKVCNCGEFIYTRKNLYTIELKDKPLHERFQEVCKMCYLKHKGAKFVDKDGFVI